MDDRPENCDAQSDSSHVFSMLWLKSASFGITVRTRLRPSEDPDNPEIHKDELPKAEHIRPEWKESSINMGIERTNHEPDIQQHPF